MGVTECSRQVGRIGTDTVSARSPKFALNAEEVMPTEIYGERMISLGVSYLS